MNATTAVLPRHTGDDLYLSNAEPMRRVDYKARKHGKPMPVRYKRVKKEGKL